ncbi:hypothetical protein F3Y22_tig00110108pilonHSYRG00092 [Hibiscus syriacus]|uniref:Ribosomal RNA methyltransferase FtsJ domain-containing protein n=1 Tax=Hibiscus syriacus TaxID=106335 RepID=A0A6A3BLE5_HIBSY|nr:hypothetical protein F3Y22_tig00110108pilonHSYRG00092 [Hibiscus syriacus]
MLSSTFVLPPWWMQVAVQRAPVAVWVLGLDLVPIAPIRGTFVTKVFRSQDYSSFSIVSSSQRTRLPFQSIIEVSPTGFQVLLSKISACCPLPLCCPRWWMQVAVQRAPIGSLVLGLDLVPIAPIRGAIALQQDITKSECKSKVKRVMEEHRVMAFDVVLHDGSPNVGGAWAQEAMSQMLWLLILLSWLPSSWLLKAPLSLRFLGPKITVLFSIVSSSPAKIDPCLLDFKHLFQGSIEPQKKVIDVLRVTKQKRHRDGYEDGETISKRCLLLISFGLFSSRNPRFSYYLEWIHSPVLAPIFFLPLVFQISRLISDKVADAIEKALSPSERLLLRLLPLLKMMIKGMRTKMINYSMMEELTYAMERKKKREKKLLAKRRAKAYCLDKSRKATGMQIDALEDGYVDHELFSLSSIKVRFTKAANWITPIMWRMLLRKALSPSEKATSPTPTTAKDDDKGDENEDDKYSMRWRSSHMPWSDKSRKATGMQIDALEDGYVDHELFSLSSIKGGDGDIILSDHDSIWKRLILKQILLWHWMMGEGPTQEEITNKWFDPKSTKLQASKVDDDFEIVPAPATDSSDDSSLDDSEDDDMKKRHRQPIKPVTKDEIAAMQHNSKRSMLDRLRSCRGKGSKEADCNGKFRQGPPESKQHIRPSLHLRMDVRAQGTGKPGKGKKKVKTEKLGKVKDLSRLQGEGKQRMAFA